MVIFNVELKSNEDEKLNLVSQIINRPTESEIYAIVESLVQNVYAQEIDPTCLFTMLKDAYKKTLSKN
jgi:hypothetical protein